MSINYNPHIIILNMHFFSQKMFVVPIMYGIVHLYYMYVRKQVFWATFKVQLKTESLFFVQNRVYCEYYEVIREKYGGVKFPSNYRFNYRF